MTGKQDYAPPTSPPPNYAGLQPISQQDTGPHASSSASVVDHHNPPLSSPAAQMTNKAENDNYQLQAYPDHNNTLANNEPRPFSPPLQQPDPAYGGFYNHNPQGGYGGPPAQGYYAPGPNANGYYGQSGPQPMQGMYYQQQTGAYGMGPGQPQPVPWGGGGAGFQQPPPMPMHPGWGPQQHPGPYPPGYYHDDRGMGGSGVCAGILGALACCCCMDMLLF